MKVTLVRARTTDSAIYKLADSLYNNGYDVKLLLWDRQGNSIVNTKYAIHNYKFKAPQDRLSAFFYFPFWWLYEFIFLMRDDSEIIHACDFDTLWPAIFVKMIKKKKLFYIIYDFYANNMPNMQPLILTNLIRSIFASIEKLGIGFTDTLFLVDECRYDEVKGSKIKKLVYLYNSPPDYSHTYKANSTHNSKLIIFYAGGMHKGRGLEYMIQAIEDIDDVKLILAGPKPGNDIQRVLKKNNKIQYIGWLPDYDQLIKLTMDSDILFRFNDPNVPKSKYESPNKLFEAMMCGKPIIVNIEIAASRIVKNERCGICVPYGDINSIKTAITTLKNDKKLRLTLGMNGRNAYDKKYSWENMEKRLLQAYSEIIRGV